MKSLNILKKTKVVALALALMGTSLISNAACPTFFSGGDPAQNSHHYITLGDGLSFTQIKATDADGGLGNGSMSANMGTATFANATAAGKNLFYDWAWTPGSTGDYTVVLTVTDGSCSDTRTFYVHVAPATPQCDITANARAAAADCYGGNGKVHACVIGGTAPYSYSWTNASNQQVATTKCAYLPAGTYSVTVTDANNCTSSSSATITEPELLTCNTTINHSVFYLGYDDVINGNSITTTTTANGGNGGYTTTGGLTNYVPTSGGTFTVTTTTTDAKGCSCNSSVTYTVKDVRCGSGNSGNLNKASICHVPANGTKSKTLCIDPADVQDHLAHGDYLGPCNNPRLAGNTSMTEAQFSVYPNPANGSVTINMVEDGEINVRLLDMQGRVVISKDFEAGSVSVKLDIQSVTPGIYFMEVNNGNENFRTKLMVQ